MELDNAAGHVVLSNIYAAAGHVVLSNIYAAAGNRHL
jgi:hypothetical protein